MNVSTRPRIWADGALVGVLVTAAFCELLVIEVYHRVGGALPGMVILALTVAVAAALLAVARRANGPMHQACARGAAFLALWTAVTFSVWPGVVARVGTVPGLGWAVLLSGAALVFLSPARLWRRLRPALAVLMAVFVLSQPVVATFRGPSLAWPPTSSGVSQDAGKEVTFLLLLDELNARESPTLEAVLRSQGLTVSARAVPAIDRNTSEAVPSMFAPGRFHGAKPCSFTATCAGDRILDFAKVQASRPDIDVVGFFHPYCSISGLRSCQRPAMRHDLTKLDRWRCAVARRLPWSMDVSATQCAVVHGELWEALRQDILTAIQQAPALSSGGMLFAHVPLPHPPGRQASGTLLQDYRENVGRAGDLIADLVKRAHANGLAVRVLIFSDHPLRQSHWCTQWAQYALAHCRHDPALDDDDVPLIVAADPGSELPPLGHISTNADVFSLVAGFRRSR